MRIWILLILLIPFSFGYVLVPPQESALVQVWTDNGVVLKYLENATHFSTNSPVNFVALDTDDNGIFDRGGVPNNDQIAIFPVGLIRGTIDGAAEIIIVCNYPGLNQFMVNNSFLLTLPAGECSMSVNQGEETFNIPLTVTANDVTDISVQAPIKKKSNPLPISIVVLILIGVGLWMLFASRAKKPTENNNFLKALSADEKAVVEYLMERGPQLVGVVRKDLAISKTTFHRLLQKLREKGLIKEEEFGNTKKIAWNESFHSK